MKTPFLTFLRTRTYCELLGVSNCNVGFIYQLKTTVTKKSLFEGAIPETTSMQGRTSFGIWGTKVLNQHFTTGEMTEADTMLGKSD